MQHLASRCAMQTAVPEGHLELSAPAGRAPSFFCVRYLDGLYEKHCRGCLLFNTYVRITYETHHENGEENKIK